MLQYIIEIIVWTVILYVILEIVKFLIYKFIISPQSIRELKINKYIKVDKYTECKTKSENESTK